MNPLNIILVDDNDTFREALKKVLITKFNANIVAEASSGAEFQQIQHLRKADVILMDVMIPDIDGITLTKKALWHEPNLKIIAITLHYDKVYLDTLIEAGFKGCIFKNNIFSELELAIETVLNNKYYFPHDITIDDKRSI
jgi:DNA-binding NarL/FixJ family response regulator